jgi:hypothetical protein
MSAAPSDWSLASSGKWEGTGEGRVTNGTGNGKDALSGERGRKDVKPGSAAAMRLQVREGLAAASRAAPVLVLPVRRLQSLTRLGHFPPSSSPSSR